MTGDLRKDYIWNTIGTAVYAFFSMVLVFAALKAAGPEDGGIFSFGFSTLGQQLFIVAYFGIRPFHITDTKREYSYRDYRSLRVLSTAAAMAAAFFYAAVMGAAGAYSLRKQVIIVLLSLYKICDGVSDLYESECQRIGKLYIGGMELAARTVLSGGSLLILLFVTGDIIVSAVFSLVMQLAVIVCFRKYLAAVLLKGIEPDAYTAGGMHLISSGCMGLFRGTLLIFLSVFADFYIFSASRYAIDLYMDDASSGIFNVIFLPASVIYIAANFIIRPFMNRLSAMWDKHDLKDFRRAEHSLLMLIAVMSAAGLIFAAVCSGPALRLIELFMGEGFYGLFAARRAELMLIVLGGCFYAVTNLYYYILIIMRRQKTIFIEYIITAAAAFAAVSILVPTYGMTGAAAAFAAYMALLAVLFYVSASHGVKSGLP